MTNPYLNRNKNDKGNHGRRAEKRHAKEVGARLTPGSGALDGAKSDMVRKGLDISLRIESKSTVNESVSLKREWLTKITREALDTNCQPILLLSFVTGSGEPKKDGDWVVMPRRLFDMLEELK